MILSGKTAIITGGTGVIGETIAGFFVREGCEVLIVGRSETALQKSREKLSISGSRIEIFRADVSQLEDVKSLMEHAERIFGRLDILVTAAGIYGEIGSLEQCDPEGWLEAIKVNLWGTMLCVKYALPLLYKSSNGKIIVFAGGGDGPMPNFTSYTSSKGAILRFTESAAAELSAKWVAINAISPGLVNSGLVRDLVRAGEERVGKDKFGEARAQLVGQGGVVSPEKAAALAVFLASDESNGLTGKSISAVWDKWQEIPNHLKEIAESDVYNWRRIKPKDRGYDW